MAKKGGTNNNYIGWEEVKVCKEKGRREIHYIMIRNDGGKVLAVIAKDNSITNTFTYRFILHNNDINKPRSRRELLLWLDSFIPDSPTPTSPRTNGGLSDVNEADELDVEAMKVQTGSQLQKVGVHSKEAQWLGSSWTCKKRRKHYQAYRRNGFKIAVNEFVHVLAEENNWLIAYLDDMYEDPKGKKMVVVRWFHKIDEVGLDLPHNYNDREIFFTPYLQDLSIECIDGLAMVLSPQHYEKFLSVAKHTKLEPYVCNRQYDSNDISPFDVSQMKGYGKQEILRYMFSISSSRPLDNGCPPEKSTKREVSYDGTGTKPRKRLRLSLDSRTNLTQGPRVTVSRTGVKVEAPQQAIAAVGSDVEVLSQDSGIRGCWFRATVIKRHKNKVKLSYHDIKDADNEANCLEEWVVTSRTAVRDDTSLRLHGRTTIRPSLLHRGKISRAFSVGSVVDAWQHDGWWEGIIIQKQLNETFRVYFPGEKREAVLGQSDLRHSQEWMNNTWTDLSERPDVAASILSGLVRGEMAAGEHKQPDCPSNLPECNKQVPDLSKDDFLSQLKWSTLGKRRRSCFSVKKLHPRSHRVNSERTLSHSPMKAGKENSENSKVDRSNYKYKPAVVPPLTNLVMPI